MHRKLERGVLSVPEDAKIEFIGLPSVEVEYSRYDELIRKEERLATIERMIANSKYVTIEDIKILLDIKGTEKGETDEQ